MAHLTENQVFNLVSGSAAAGQSTYDMWKSIEGNENKSVQDFLNYLKDDGESNVSEETLAQIEKNKNDISQLTEEKVDNPSSGSVGQILEIESVDENGKPKTYKAVNKPTSGGVSDEQISSAVSDYFEANPVEVDEWKILVPTDNGMKPINTLTNERSIREKAIQLNAEGTKAHNLAMVRLAGNYFFATWIEYTSVDNANGGSQCFEKWAVLKVANKVISVDNWTYAANTFSVSVISSGTLFDGETITNGTITDASDACIFRLSETKLAVMAKVTCGTSTAYACTATIEFDSSYTATITYSEPTINDNTWDMSTVDSSWNRFYQFNNEPCLVSSVYYLPIVVDYKGIQVLSTTDGIAFTTAYFVECEHAYLEVSLNKTSATRFFMTIRSKYNDGSLYLASGTVTDGLATIASKRRILGVGSARPHIMRCNNQNSGGAVGNMPFYVFCCDAERKNGHLYRIRTYGSWGCGTIVEAVDVSTWNNICCYPAHIDFTGNGNISSETPVRNQLFGGTDISKNNVYVFPIAILDKYQNYSYRDGVDILASSSMIVDSTPTEGSENPVSSGGVYSALQSSVGGSDEWINVANETLSVESAGFTGVTLAEAKKINKIRVYCKIVGTENCSDSYDYLQLLVGNVDFFTEDNTISREDGTIQYVIMELDVFKSFSTCRYLTQQSTNGHKQSTSNGYAFQENLNTDTEVTSIKLRSGSNFGMLGVGSSCKIDVVYT